MIFEETLLKGAYIISLEEQEDERGFFARSWCRREFSDLELDSRLVQCNISFNRRSGTLRGMHYQVPPSAESKLVRCTQGAIYDVLLDIRPDSPTFGSHFGIELTQDNRLQVFVPAGFAHGFLTLEDLTEVFYQMSEYFSPEHSRGVRWDDPMFDIPWPRAISVISERDRGYPNSLPGQFAALADLVHGD